MNIACNNRLYPFIWAWCKREPSNGREKKWQSINTNHWCGKLILDCFSGFVQNCFVEGKKEIKALIILGNSFHKINTPFLKGLFRCGNVVSVTRQGYNETQQTRCSPISLFKLSSSIFQHPSHLIDWFNSHNPILTPLVKELPGKAFGNSGNDMSKWQERFSSTFYSFHIWFAFVTRKVHRTCRSIQCRRIYQS